MKTKTILISAILFCCGFGCGYWLDEWANQRSFRNRYTQSLGWAIHEGIITVNQDRLGEMGNIDSSEDGNGQ